MMISKFTVKFMLISQNKLKNVPSFNKIYPPEKVCVFKCIKKGNDTLKFFSNYLDFLFLC